MIFFRRITRMIIWSGFGNLLAVKDEWVFSGSPQLSVRYHQEPDFFRNTVEADIGFLHEDDTEP
jgi:hypothetical protein|tara:strand:- start:1529 stop:1720 length:192 start_codon:yes stop_codon:yes gene_type:complete